MVTTFFAGSERQGRASGSNGAPSSGPGDASPQEGANRPGFKANT